MARKADGYFTSDGTFYEREEEADLHDAKEAIRGELIGQEIAPDPIIVLLDTMRELIEDYYEKATAEAKTRTSSDLDSSGEVDHFGPEPGGSEIDPPDDSGGEAGTESVQQQPRTRRKSVPNMGRRKRTKAIQDDGKEHGT